MAGEEPTVVEELQALAQYQLAVHPSGIPGSTAQKTLNTLLGPFELLLRKAQNYKLKLFEKWKIYVQALVFDHVFSGSLAASIQCLSTKFALSNLSRPLCTRKQSGDTGIFTLLFFQSVIEVSLHLQGCTPKFVAHLLPLTALASVRICVLTTLAIEPSRQAVAFSSLPIVKNLLCPPLAGS